MAARAYKVRDVNVQWRDGKLEQIGEATTRGVGLSLYVDGRFSAVSSSDLRPEALETFIGDAVAMTRSLAQDPFRTLPDPKLYEGQAKADLQLEDPAYATVTPEQRRQVAQEIETRGAGREGGRGHPLRDHRRSATTGRSRCASTRTASRAPAWTPPSGSQRPGEREGPRRPPARGLRLGRRALRGRAAEARPRSARPPPSAPSPAWGRRSPRRPSCPWCSRTGPRAGWWAPSPRPCPGQALQQKRSFLEGKLGQERGQRRLDPHRRPAPGQGLRLAPLRRRGDRGPAAPDLREGRAAQLLHRHLLREEAARWRPPPAGPRTW